MDEEGKSRIGDLNETLNSRTRYRDPQDKRTPVKQLDTPDVENKWQTPALDEMLKHERVVQPLNPFMKKVFMFALIFFVGAVIVAGYIFTGGANFISSKNVDIGILGPTTVSAGATLELGVSISNTNNADLEVANLSIQYPQGARNAANTGESLTFTKDDLGVIEAGEEATRNVRFVLLGTTNEVKEIKFSVAYQVKGSNATFYKDKIYEVTIGNAPITLDVENPISVNSGGEFNTKVTVTLNATDILKNVVLKAEYPYGYNMISSVPSVASDDNIWLLGDLSPGDKKTVNIKGRLIGENQEERTFRFYVGVADSGTTPNLKIPIASLLDTLSIDRPSIGLNISLNGDSGSTYISTAARTISADVKFQNNLTDKLLNPHLEVVLSGQALDKLSVRPSNNGIYDPTSSKIVWDIRNNVGGSELAPGASGQVSFLFASLPKEAITGNNNIALNFSVNGIPVAAVGQGVVSATESRTVKISSQINFASKALRSLGPFANHGNVPPKVGQETTYTIVFSLGNVQDAVNSAQITAKLGPNVTWLGAPSTVLENITYDSAANTLKWDIGNLNPNSDGSSTNRELAFQVSLKPILGQVGTVPVLVNNIAFSAKDNTGAAVNVTNPAITTKLTSDPAFIQGDDIVVK